MLLLFIGAAEIVLIVFAVLLLFGSKKIPEVARAIGKGYREFQKATEDIKRELSNLEKDDSTPTSRKNSGNNNNTNGSDNQ